MAFKVADHLIMLPFQETRLLVAAAHLETTLRFNLTPTEFDLSATPEADAHRASLE